MHNINSLKRATMPVSRDLKPSVEIMQEFLT